MRQSFATEPLASLTDLDLLSAASKTVELTTIRPKLAQALRTLRQAGITLSDRRAVRTQRLIAAATTLAGRTEATPADLWPLIYAVPTRDEQALAREALRPLLATAENAALPHAAEEASLGPLARAQRLSGGIRKLLAAPPDEPAALAAWKLRLEGALREIDAGFAPERLPEELTPLRQKLIEWVRV
jgi:MoxR-like ATPase